MNVTINFPDTVSTELKRIDNINLFIISVVKEALVERQDLKEWQKQKIEKAIQRADSGKETFTEHDHVKNWLLSWGTDNEKSPNQQAKNITVSHENSMV